MFSDLLAGKEIKVPQVIKPAQEEEVTAIFPARPEVVSDEAEERQCVRIHTKALDTILNLVGEVFINQYPYEGQLTAIQEIVQELREQRRRIAELQKLAKDGEENGSQLQLAPIAEQRGTDDP